MKTHVASLINAIILIVFGAWGYFGSDTPSITALIPVIFGIVILALNRGIRNENKVLAHIAVLLTIVILAGLARPLMGAIERADSGAVTRILIMFLSTIQAIILFVKSFIDARKAKG